MKSCFYPLSDFLFSISSAKLLIVGVCDSVFLVPIKQRQITLIC